MKFTPHILTMKSSLYRIMLAFMLPLFSSSFFSCQGPAENTAIKISIDQLEVEMGRSIRVEAQLGDVGAEERMIMLPFINGKRWGSHEFADKDGKASFIIPLPNPGPALVQVIAVEAETDTWLGLKDETLLKTGTYMPECELKSKTELVLVKNRKVRDL